ncbi:hypothetical protein H8K20_09715 [Neobittarella massiliensis]|uniref:Ketoreductase (KR) domain-containing protein n=1 Tax=Neobittarella massiliensis (ex Bilen et al. 2018) TaxID=2041842 RepID=A0A8J6IN61_9FIRM|nr:hypothetical protein [Neobittarella massiliensis]MBC3516669.1 hypothetical protein [Neobittarella massiliensis]
MMRDMGATIAPFTGATGGIGRCFIEQLLREPVGEIWAVARTAQRQPPPRTDLSPSIAPIPANLSCPAALPAPGQRLQDQSPVVKYLIDHAGGGSIALFISFTAAEVQPSINPASAQHQSSIAVCCTATAALCGMCVSYMQAGTYAAGSRIVNISLTGASQASF